MLSLAVNASRVEVDLAGLSPTWWDPPWPWDGTFFFLGLAHRSKDTLPPGSYLPQWRAHSALGPLEPHLSDPHVNIVLPSGDPYQSVSDGRLFFK